MSRNILIALFCLVQLHAVAQTKPSNAMGSKTLYTAPRQLQTQAPKSYQPVYINHVGRHGARHLTKDISLSFAYRVLKNADSLNLLSPKGKELRTKLANLQIEERGHVASISVIGENELKGIATRTFKLYPNVFKNTKPLTVATTKKGRTKESAEAYLKGLKENDTTTRKLIFNYADDDNLRFYDFSGAYHIFEEKGSWLPAYQQLAKELALQKIASEFSAIFFSKQFLNSFTPQDKIKFTEDIYGFYTILAAVDVERKQANLQLKDLDFGAYFTSSQLATLNLLGNAEDFLKKGPGLDKNGIQVRIAAPLLADFIKKTDDFIKNGIYAADLRFAHAETIAPFAAIMGIVGAAEDVKTINQFNQHWKAEKIIPFSANIQWVFYKNNTGNYLVKFLLNENEVAIEGLNKKHFPYYSWAEVRQLYLQKLKSLNVGLDTDMHQYLLNVK